MILNWVLPFRRTRHTGQLCTCGNNSKRDGRQRLILALDLDVLFRFDSLMRSSDHRRPGISRPVNSSTMITSPSFTAYSNVLIESVRFDRSIDVMLGAQFSDLQYCQSREASPPSPNPRP